MVARRLPKAVLEARGTFKHDPKRREGREDELQDERELGEPPLHLTARAHRAWMEIAETCAPGMLRQSDRLALEAFATLWSNFRETRGTDWNASDWQRLQQFFTSFGMTPSDRAKLRAHMPDIGKQSEPKPNRFAPDTD